MQTVNNNLLNKDLLESLKIKEYSVSELSTLIRRKLEEDYSSVRVVGEVSGLKIAPSGHIYFSLKDSNSLIASICWKSVASKLSIKLVEGLEIVCIGSITTYPLQSKYQLIVEHFEISGDGALMAILQKRKEMLTKEGLFDPSRKKKIPFFPKKIGIVTSPTGAVIQDILHRISDRMPSHVILWPVLVQGDKAALQIAEAISGFNSMQNKVDVIIVARGGGSVEDLWAFNEEIVVRAAADSKIPLISAIGHETDTTLIDYASDLRAPTPTAAAEMAVPVKTDLIYTIKAQEQILYYSINNHISNKNNFLKATYKSISGTKNIFTTAQQMLDNYSMRLDTSIFNYIKNKNSKLQLNAAKNSNPLIIIENFKQKLKFHYSIIKKTVNNNLMQNIEKISYITSLLESYNYKKVLQRGYSLIRDKDKKIISSINNFHYDEVYKITLYDGDVKVKKID